MTRHVVYGARTGRYVQEPLDWALCGTPAQAAAHRRRGQKPCPKCLEAETRYSVDRKRRRRAARNETR